DRQRPRTCARCPYTTLFRSGSIDAAGLVDGQGALEGAPGDFQVVSRGDVVESGGGYIPNRGLHLETGGQPGLIACLLDAEVGLRDRKSTRLNSSHVKISYAV